ncbi:MAG: hypothetical protein ABIZ81_00345 [Opitutaceae bacterium]
MRRSPAETRPREAHGGAAILRVEFAEEVFDVLSHRGGRAGQNGGNLGVAFAVRDPVEHFALARGETGGAQVEEVGMNVLLDETESRSAVRLWEAARHSQPRVDSVLKAKIAASGVVSAGRTAIARAMCASNAASSS